MQHFIFLLCPTSFSISSSTFIRNTPGKTFNFLIHTNTGCANFKFVLYNVKKTDRPNTTPTVRAICTFAVYFLVRCPDTELADTRWNGSRGYELICKSFPD